MSTSGEYITLEENIGTKNKNKKIVFYSLCIFGLMQFILGIVAYMISITPDNYNKCFTSETNNKKAINVLNNFNSYLKFYGIFTNFTTLINMLWILYYYSNKYKEIGKNLLIYSHGLYLCMFVYHMYAAILLFEKELNYIRKCKALVNIFMFEYVNLVLQILLIVMLCITYIYYKYKN